MVELHTLLEVLQLFLWLLGMLMQQALGLGGI